MAFQSLATRVQHLIGHYFRIRPPECSISLVCIESTLVQLPTPYTSSAILIPGYKTAILSLAQQLIDRSPCYSNLYRIPPRLSYYPDTKSSFWSLTECSYRSIDQPTCYSNLLLIPPRLSYYPDTKSSFWSLTECSYRSISQPVTVTCSLYLLGYPITLIQNLRSDVCCVLTAFLNQVGTMLSGY
jgi:hypothetical protein